ncbi:conserved protein of unknown function [Pararobbsia alpina]|jgi:hypothetical protein|uniref:hypothetical protein n=1 Tax=Pararobbsia alpina TaxID=621374 RepID=UPI0039A6B627
MSIPNKRRRESAGDSYLLAVKRCEPFSQLNSKLARARAHDEPVLYAHILPGLDVLLCPVRGAQPPYPEIEDLRNACLDSIEHALEQSIGGLENGGYWYEANGLGFLIFASLARKKVLSEFGASGSTGQLAPSAPDDAP